MDENAIVIAPEDAGPHAIEVQVLKVFDGDGFLTRMSACQKAGEPGHGDEVEVAVRLGFIDAPELQQPGGREAQAFLDSLIGGRTVWLNILTKMDTGQSVDRHGRVVAVPYVREAYAECTFATPDRQLHHVHRFGRPLSLSRNIELEMVLNGWAWVVERYEPHQRYLEALEDARRNRRGIWALSENMPLWEYKRLRAIQTYVDRSKAVASNAPDCPAAACGGSLVRRMGKFGAFLGCTNYPRCRYSCAIAAE